MAARRESQSISYDGYLVRAKPAASSHGASLKSSCCISGTADSGEADGDGDGHEDSAADSRQDEDASSEDGEEQLLVGAEEDVAATLTQSSARVPASCAARASCALRTLTCFCSWQIALARKSGLVRTDGNYIRYDGSSLSLREPDGELDGVAAAVSLPRFCAGHRVSEVVVPPTGGPMAHDPRRPGAAGSSSSVHAVRSPHYKKSVDP